MQPDSDVQKRVRECVSLVLRIPVDAGDDLVRADTPQWDSLRHVELALFLEEEFNLRLEVAEIAEMSSLQSIVDLVTRKGS